MAKSIGKVIVSIEAKVEELEAGLAKAEATMKASADRLAAQNDKLSSKFTKSWVEFSSKLNVVTSAARIAKQAWDLVDGVLTVVTNKTLNASSKILGTMNAIEKSGTPVVSQFMAIGHGIHGWITGEKNLARAVAAREAVVRAAAKANKERQDLRIQTASILSKTLGDLQYQAKIESEITETGKQRIKNEKQYGELKTALDKKIADLEGKATDSFIKEQKTKRDMILRLAMEQHDAAMQAAGEIDKINRTAHENRMREIVEERRAKEQAVQDAIAAEEKAANKINTAKMDLITRLAILEAEAEGDTEKAQLIALDARIKKEKEAIIKLGQAAAEPRIAQEKEKEVQAIEESAAVGGELFFKEHDKVTAEYERLLGEIAQQLLKEKDFEEKVKLWDKSRALQDERDIESTRMVEEGIDPAIIEAEIAKVEAKYKALREERSEATEEQLALINQIAELEKKQITKATDKDKELAEEEATAVEREGKTETFSTAIGSFTVAANQSAAIDEEQTSLLETISKTPELLTKIAGDTEGKKRTTLLDKIASSNEKMADALTSGADSGAIIPAG
jgi:hypothetical protein